MAKGCRVLSAFKSPLRQKAFVDTKLLCETEMDFWNLVSFVLFVLVWATLEPLMAAGLPRRNDSLSKDMVLVRAAWMREVLTRDDNFIGDAAILGHSINSASFFGSANLIVMVALSGTLFVDPSYQGGRGLLATFTSHDPAWFFQCKVLLVLATLLRGLSDFIWAVRQMNYCLAAIGASPARKEGGDIAAWAYALTMIVNPALRSFSIGVRSYHFTVAAAAWFFGPISFLTATMLSVGLLIWRQSYSDTAKGMAAVRKLLE